MNNIKYTFLFTLILFIKPKFQLNFFARRGTRHGKQLEFCTGVLQFAGIRLFLYAVLIHYNICEPLMFMKMSKPFYFFIRRTFSFQYRHFPFSCFSCFPLEYLLFITRVSRFFDNDFVTLSWIAIRFQHNFFTSLRNI